VLWFLATIGILAAACGPLQWILGQKKAGTLVIAGGTVIWIYLAAKIRKRYGTSVSS